MPSAEIAINMQKWNALSPDLKVLVEVAVRDFAREMVQRIAMEDMKAAETAKAQGVTLVEWSPEERRKFRDLSRRPGRIGRRRARLRSRSMTARSPS